MTQFELLEQLQAAEADLRRRATEANQAGLENRQKRRRAMEVFKAATVADDQDAQAEAQALIKQLDADFELLEAQEQALLAVLTEGREPMASIARQIKQLAEAEARERRREWDALDLKLGKLSQEYLDTVAAMGMLHMQGAGVPWEAAKGFLPRGQDVLTGRALPSHAHENARGPIYKLTPALITATFRKGVNSHV